MSRQEQEHRVSIPSYQSDCFLFPTYHTKYSVAIRGFLRHSGGQFGINFSVCVCVYVYIHMHVQRGWDELVVVKEENKVIIMETGKEGIQEDSVHLIFFQDSITISFIN